MTRYVQFFLLSCVTLVAFNPSEAAGNDGITDLKINPEETPFTAAFIRMTDAERLTMLKYLAKIYRQVGEILQYTEIIKNLTYCLTLTNLSRFLLL